MKSISISKLSAGSGSAKIIQKGGSLIVTDNGVPVAHYRPHKEGDKGKVTSAGKFYDMIPTCMGYVHQGQQVTIMRRGEPFATLCPYEKSKTGRSRAKRHAKRRRSKSATPPPLEFRVMTVQELAKAARILRAMIGLPEEKAITLLKLGAELAQKSELEWSLAMLKSLVAKR